MRIRWVVGHPSRRAPCPPVSSPYSSSTPCLDSMTVEFGCKFEGFSFGKAKLTEGANCLWIVKSYGNSDEEISASKGSCVFGIRAEFQFDEVDTSVFWIHVLRRVGRVSAFKG
eukprot:1157755-Pelagomonas_calceolata.AAC.11